MSQPSPKKWLDNSLGLVGHEEFHGRLEPKKSKRSIHLKTWLFLHLKHLWEKETGLLRNFYTQVPIYPWSPRQALKKRGNFTQDYVLRREIWSSHNWGFYYFHCLWLSGFIRPITPLTSGWKQAQLNPLILVGHWWRLLERPAFPNMKGNFFTVILSGCHWTHGQWGTSQEYTGHTGHCRVCAHQLGADRLAVVESRW